MKYYSCLEEVSNIDLKTKDQIIIVQDLDNEHYNIINYKLSKSMHDIIYIFFTNGIYINTNNNAVTKNVTKTYVKINGKFMNINCSSHGLYSGHIFPEMGFNIVMRSKTCICNFAFDYKGKIDVNIKYEWKNSINKLLYKRTIQLRENETGYNIIIPDCNNFDILMNLFLDEIDDENKQKFVNVINTMNFSRKDYLDNNIDKFNQFSDLIIKYKLATKKILNNINNQSFRLNDNVIVYYPIMCTDSNADFIFTDNDNNIIDYKLSSIEVMVLEYVKKHYLNKINGYKTLVDPFTGKFDKRTYEIEYESSTGMILKSKRNSSSLSYYLKYNNIYYVSGKYQDDFKLKEEYDIFKKITS